MINAQIFTLARIANEINTLLSVYRSSMLLEYNMLVYNGVPGRIVPTRNIWTIDGFRRFSFSVSTLTA